MAGYKMNTGMIQSFLLGIVLLVVLFQLLADLVPTAQEAGNELNASGVPLGSLFTGGGIVFIILMAGVLLLVVKHYMPSK